MTSLDKPPIPPLPSQEAAPFNPANPAPFNPYQASERTFRLDATTDSQYRPAQRIMRLAAAILDTLIMALIFIVFALIPLAFGASMGSGMSSASFASVGGFFILAMFLAFITNIVVQLISLNASAQTLGKRLVGIQVIHVETNQPCALGRYIGLRVMVPYLLTFIPLVGGLFWLVDTLFIFAEDRRCLHDRIADTMVVEK